MLERLSHSSPSRVTIAVQLFAILALTAILLASTPAGFAIEGGAVLKILFLCRMPLLLALATWFLRMRGLYWRDVGLRRPRWLLFILAIPLGLAAAQVLGSLVTLSLSEAGFHTTPYAVFRPLRGDLLEYLFWALPVSWGSAAFCEEMIFRGFVLDALERLIGSTREPAIWAAMVLQALLFGLAHIYLGIGGVAIAATTGFVLSMVWRLSGRNLWAGIIVHGLLDFSAMTAIFLGAVRV